MKRGNCIFTDTEIAKATKISYATNSKIAERIK